MRRVGIAMLIAACQLLVSAPASAQSFQLMETSIADVHQAMHKGTVTCHELVEQYLKRVRKFDQEGPKVNAMLYVDPRALQQADAMDQEFKRTGKLKPLGCIPVVLKDNFDTD